MKLAILLILTMISAVSADRYYVYPKYSSCCNKVESRAVRYHANTKNCCKRTSCRTCSTHNNVVKEINGGTPRYVTNGTYTVCNQPQDRRRLTENYGWSWNRMQPYYRKVPIYLDERPSSHRYNYSEDDYAFSRDRARRAYYYW